MLIDYAKTKQKIDVKNAYFPVKITQINYQTFRIIIISDTPKMYWFFTLQIREY